jgi:hypothetical protein
LYSGPARRTTPCCGLPSENVAEFVRIQSRGLLTSHEFSYPRVWHWLRQCTCLARLSHRIWMIKFNLRPYGPTQQASGRVVSALRACKCKHAKHLLACAHTSTGKASATRVGASATRRSPIHATRGIRSQSACRSCILWVGIRCVSRCEGALARESSCAWIPGRQGRRRWPRITLLGRDAPVTKHHHGGETPRVQTRTYSEA